MKEIIELAKYILALCKSGEYEFEDLTEIKAFLEEDIKADEELIDESSPDFKDLIKAKKDLLASFDTNNPVLIAEKNLLVAEKEYLFERREEKCLKEPSNI